MRLKYDPISYIMKYGKPHHKLRILIALNKRGEDFYKLFAMLKQSQKNDGGWAWLGYWSFSEPRPSSTFDTAKILDVILDAGEDKNSEVVEKAVAFLFNMQRNDGGWSENPSVNKAIKREWIWYSTKYSITWVTGKIISVLIKAGYRDDPRVGKALDFLRKMQNREGGWPSHGEAPERTDMWANGRSN